MRVWRISSYPGLTGIGGTMNDGRWHSKGSPIIYAAEHPALAMVETMAHMKLSPSNIPLTLKLIAIDVADGIAAIDVGPLPVGWQANEPTTRQVGNNWLTSGVSLAMRVPSALVTDAYNYLINPAHPQAATHLREVQVQPFWLDHRLL